LPEFSNIAVPEPTGFAKTTNIHMDDLLTDARNQMMDLWKVCDDSIADYILQLEIAINFVDRALVTAEYGDTTRALRKALEALERESEGPDDQGYDELVNRLRTAASEAL
jgi:hypothetical protein